MKSFYGVTVFVLTCFTKNKRFFFQKSGQIGTVGVNAACLVGWVCSRDIEVVPGKTVMETAPMDEHAISGIVHVSGKHSPKFAVSTTNQESIVMHK